MKKIYLSLQKSISVMMLSRGKRSVVEEAGVVTALDTLLGFIRHNSLGVKLVIRMLTLIIINFMLVLSLARFQVPDADN